MGELMDGYWSGTYSGFNYPLRLPQDVRKEFEVFCALADCSGGAVFRPTFRSSNSS
jgi:hypothetical protein